MNQASVELMALRKENENLQAEVTYWRKLCHQETRDAAENEQLRAMRKAAEEWTLLKDEICHDDRACAFAAQQILLGRGPNGK